MSFCSGRKHINACCKHPHDLGVVRGGTAGKAGGGAEQSEAFGEHSSKGREIKRILSLFLAVFIAFEASAQYVDSKCVETYLQYLPAAADLGMEYLGATPEHGIIDRGIEMGIAYATEIVVVNLILKNVVHEMRPDGTSANSFPSGHTCTAFIGAELLRQEYGWTWGIPAYAVATSVGVLRVVHQRHYWWDALAGAGIGILCANTGAWLREPFKNLFHITTKPVEKKDLQLAFTPTADPVSGAICTSLVLTF